MKENEKFDILLDIIDTNGNKIALRFGGFLSLVQQKIIEDDKIEWELKSEEFGRLLNELLDNKIIEKDNDVPGNITGYKLTYKGADLLKNDGSYSLFLKSEKVAQKKRKRIFKKNKSKKYQLIGIIIAILGLIVTIIIGWDKILKFFKI